MNLAPNNINQQNNQNLYNGYYQNENLNSNQINEVNKNPDLIPEFSNNNFNNNVANKKLNNNNKFIKIVILIIVVAVLIVGYLFFSNRKESVSGNNGYTVERDEILKVDELLYKFNMEILSIEKNYPIDYIGDEIDSLAIKVKITNNSDENLEFSLLQFQILDNENNKIESVNAVSQAIVYKEAGIFDDKNPLIKNESKSGYLFFYNNDDEITKKINSNNISKLVVSVPIDAYEENGLLYIDYEDYYFNLK